MNRTVMAVLSLSLSFLSVQLATAASHREAPLIMVDPRVQQSAQGPALRAPVLTSQQARYVRQALAPPRQVQLHSIAYALAQQPVASSDVQQKWRQLIAAQAHKQKMTERDVNALVQWVLRQSYLENAAEFSYYADKVRFFKTQKKAARERLATLHKLGRTSNRWEADIKRWEAELKSVDDDAQLANIDMQNWLQKQQQALQMLSKMSKMLHDTAMAVIRKIGG